MVRRAVAFFPRLEVVSFFDVLVLLFFFAAAFLRLRFFSITTGHVQVPGSTTATVFRFFLDVELDLCPLIIGTSSISAAVESCTLGSMRVCR